MPSAFRVQHFPGGRPPGGAPAPDGRSRPLARPGPAPPSPLPERQFAGPARAGPFRYRAGPTRARTEAALPNALDLIVVASITVLWPAWENAIAWPRFLRDVSGGAPGVRIAGYQHAVATEWAVSLFALLAWILRGHAWSLLPLFATAPWRLALGALLAVGMIVLMAVQLASVRKNPATRDAVRRQIGALEPLLPRTHGELPWFLALSVTAGVCEEWLFRGVLTTLLAGWIGLPLAVAASCVAFGFAHAYQGPAGIAKTALVGLAFSAIVLATGSLVPAMIVHAAIDVGSGLAAYVVLNERTALPAEGGAPEA